MYENKLKDLKNDENLKSNFVASSIGVSKSKYSEWENGKSVIPIRRIIELADFYNINIDYMLGLTNVKKHIKPCSINLKIIGERLHYIRTYNNLSFTQIDKLLGICSSAFYYYEVGERLINTKALLKIANFYNYSIDFILGRSDDMKIKKS